VTGGAGIATPEIGLWLSRVDRSEFAWATPLFHRHVPSEVIDNEAAKHTLTNSLKCTCVADGKKISGMPSGV